MVEERAMEPPCEKPSINVCATIKCPFFELKLNSGKCPRYSQASQCHLRTVADVESNGFWLVAAEDSDVKSLKKVNDRFLAKDKASQKQIKLLSLKASQAKEDSPEVQASSTLEAKMPTGG